MAPVEQPKLNPNQLAQKPILAVDLYAALPAANALPLRSAPVPDLPTQQSLMKILALPFPAPAKPILAAKAQLS